LESRQGHYDDRIQTEEAEKTSRREITPITLNDCPLIETDLSIERSKGKALASSNPITHVRASANSSSLKSDPP
jgi:hypothetical protein